jgi:Uma2 family endonuclease
MSIHVPASEQRFRLSLVSWEKYEQMAAWFEGRHCRLTYDRGELEIMTVSHPHEVGKKVIGTLVVMLAVELKTEFHQGGSMTFKRENLDRGLEPDECYWIEHESQMRNVGEYDPHQHPPPDLVLEVEVSRSALDRMGIYAAMKVSEVWRWNGETLSFWLLKRGKHVESPVSRSFPMLSAHELARFVRMRGTMGETSLVLTFREWVREQQTLGWPTAPNKGQHKPRSKR